MDDVKIGKEKYPYCGSFRMTGESRKYLAVGDEVFFLRADDENPTADADGKFNMGVAKINIICDKDNDVSKLLSKVKDIAELTVTSKSYPFNFKLYTHQILCLLNKGSEE